MADHLLRKVRLLLTVLLVALGFSASTAFAQTFVRIESRYHPDQQINTEGAGVQSSPAQPGWWSADWTLTPTGEANTYKIVNRYRAAPLSASAGGIQTVASQSQTWILESVEGYYRLRSVQNPGKYLHTENGKLELGTVQPGWWSAQWKLIGFTPAASAPSAGEQTQSDDAFLGARTPVAANRTPAPAPAAPVIPMPFVQCVKNVFGSGIIARVKWYDPKTIDFTPSADGRDNPNTPEDESLGKLDLKWATPVAQKDVPVFQDSCVAGLRPNQVPRIAIISVVGGKYANAAVSVSLGTLIGIGGAVACVGTGGVACPVVAGVAGSVANGAVSLATLGLPEAKEVFYIGTPGMLEVKGTAFDPSFKETAPLK